jgi:hypothetical protein
MASPRWLIACASIVNHKLESGNTEKAFLYPASFTFLVSFPSATDSGQSVAVEI